MIWGLLALVIAAAFAGAVVLVSNWPYTLLGIMPTNRQLLATAPESADATTRSLLQQWGSVACGAEWFRRDRDGAVPGGGVAALTLAKNRGGCHVSKHPDAVQLRAAGDGAGRFVMRRCSSCGS